jgi:phosphohistidine swiveling domain-containing protein
MSSKKDKIYRVKWVKFAQRKIEDFPPIILSYFLIGNWRIWGFKNILYINDNSDLFAFRGKEDLENLYYKIQRFKRNKFLEIARNTRNIISKTLSLLENIKSNKLAKLSDHELSKKINNLNKDFYEFAAYFVYVQYIGHVFNNNPKILKYFDNNTLHIIRVKPLIYQIQKKLKIVFTEISARRPIKKELLKWCFSSEIEKILINKNVKYFDKLNKKIKLRQKYFIWALMDGKEFFCAGETAKKIANDFLKLKESNFRMKAIRGNKAYRGLVKGVVRIVRGRKDFKKIKKGDILTAVVVMPYFLQVIKKAGAIITNEGGLLSHASIMARELNKPCIIGTKIATQVLRDGDLVEVDAEKGVVRILKRAK